ncbi:hypothetical protein WP12_06815 [Sphingomonas sp. SRS2]|nr:hypothetical protein WP12_06815 [Sphingomonas sp. SRS2]
MRNQWYVIASSAELVPGTPLARTLLAEPILLWRSEGGDVSALADFCPHRYAPLSFGRLDHEGVRCGYHGLKFDGRGRCIDNPHGPIVSTLAVQAFSVVERHGYIWLWMGKQDLVDASRIPDLGFIDERPATAVSQGYLFSKADHRLFEDNIFDLSHVDYLHASALGGGSVTRSKGKVTEGEGGAVRIEWSAEDEVPFPLFKPDLPPGANVDMLMSVEWFPSGVMIHRTQVTPTGTPMEQGFGSWNAHFMMPETARTTHYFFCNTRDYRADDAYHNAARAAHIQEIFGTQDKPIIEAQQLRLGDADLFDREPRLLPTDAASTRARRVYNRMLADEVAAW